ncbi:MAG: ABC transporter substrate-binding protein [Halobacteriales archaeon]
MPDNDRREFMKKMGVVGTSIGTVSIAGCTGGGAGEDDGGDGDGGGGGGGGTTAPGDGSGKNIESGLPDDRKIEGPIIHLSNTERYWPERYQANVLVDKALRDKLDLPVKTEPIEFTVIQEREQKGDFHMETYNWSQLQGDPDSVMRDKHHSDGPRNYHRYENPDFDEIAEKQKVETDRKKRQELVYEGQKILGEDRPEHQYVHLKWPYAVRTDHIDPDTLVVNSSGPRNAWCYTQMEPVSEKGKVVTTNNWDPSDSQNPLHHGTTGPSRNATPMGMIHDFPIRLDKNGQPKKWAARDITWEDDTTNVVTYRKDMQFHDGESATADDVVWTYNLILDTAPPAYQTFVNDVLDGVEKTGKYEVTFNLTEPYAPFVAVTLGQIPILPAHYWEELIEETGAKEKPWQISISDDRPVIGSGPFKYGLWDQGTRYEQPAFKDHFNAPNIDKRVQRPLKTRDAELEAIKKGEYDILDYWFGDYETLANTADERDDIELFTSLSDGRQTTWTQTKRPPFSDVRMRQAVFAIIKAEQPTIISELYKGFGQEAFTVISPLTKFWYNPDTPYNDIEGLQYKSGQDVAIKILNDAGYKWDGEGNIYYPEGEVQTEWPELE